MKQCRACLEWQPTTEFNQKRSRPGGLQSECRTCNRERSRRYYAENREKHKRVTRANSASYVKRNQDWLVAYLREHPCVDCTESDITVLEFDHLGDKDRDICYCVRSGWSLTRLQNEIAKCEVVCANCHRRRTAKQFNTYRHQASEALSG